MKKKPRLLLEVADFFVYLHQKKRHFKLPFVHVYHETHEGGDGNIAFFISYILAICTSNFHRYCISLSFLHDSSHL